jgi:outer membrane lipoprotein-sorting protein
METMTVLKPLLLILTLLSTVTFADKYAGMSPEEKGLAIATAADEATNGFIDSQANMKMILTNRHGQSSERELRVRSMEVENDGDKSMTIFDSPADVKGTALLTFSHKVKDDDQWLYLPAVRRVKRMSSSNKSGPFMGSEFAFEDLGSQEVEKYTWKYLRDEVLDGVDTYVLERIPVNKRSGYTRQVLWTNKETLYPLKTDFYDRKDSLLKTLTFSDYKQYLGKFWRAHNMMMVNHQTGKKTELIWRDIQYQNGFSDSDFNRNSLQRLR